MVRGEGGEEAFWPLPPAFGAAMAPCVVAENTTRSLPNRRQLLLSPLSALSDAGRHLFTFFTSLTCIYTTASVNSA